MFKKVNGACKEAFYFPHDYEAMGDPKLQALVGEFGDDQGMVFLENN